MRLGGERQKYLEGPPPPRAPKPPPPTQAEMRYANRLRLEALLDFRGDNVEPKY